MKRHVLMSLFGVTMLIALTSCNPFSEEKPNRTETKKSDETAKNETKDYGIFRDVFASTNNFYSIGHGWGWSRAPICYPLHLSTLRPPATGEGISLNRFTWGTPPYDIEKIGYRSGVAYGTCIRGNSPKTNNFFIVLRENGTWMLYDDETLFARHLKLLGTTWDAADLHEAKNVFLDFRKGKLTFCSAETTCESLFSTNSVVAAMTRALRDNTLSDEDFASTIQLIERMDFPDPRYTEETSSGAPIRIFCPFDSEAYVEVKKVFEKMETLDYVSVVYYYDTNKPGNKTELNGIKKRLDAQHDAPVNIVINKTILIEGTNRLNAFLLAVETESPKAFDGRLGD